MTTNVFFEVHEPQAVMNYCKKNGIQCPVLYSEQLHGGDYYKSTFEVWEQLYRNGGYGPEGWPLAAGCYPC